MHVTGTKLVKISRKWVSRCGLREELSLRESAKGPGQRFGAQVQNAGTLIQGIHSKRQTNYDSYSL